MGIVKLSVSNHNGLKLNIWDCHNNTSQVQKSVLKVTSARIIVSTIPLYTISLYNYIHFPILVLETALNIPMLFCNAITCVDLRNSVGCLASSCKRSLILAMQSNHVSRSSLTPSAISGKTVYFYRLVVQSSQEHHCHQYFFDRFSLG